MAVPVLTSLSPASGPTAGGTAVMLTGSNMGAVTAVSFGATPAADFALMSATQVVALPPAGTGIVAVKVTNADGDSGTVSYQFTDGLFTVAEARAFDGGKLGEGALYPDAAIIAKEAEIRAFFKVTCAVDFVPTVHTDEYHSGDGTRWLILDWPLATAPSAASTRADTTWTALTADELAALHVDPDTGSLYREGSYWPCGVRNLRLTYTAGHTSVPAEVKAAALKIVVSELPATSVSWSAETYEAGGMSVSFAAGDGFNGAWHSIAEVRRAIRLYSRKLPGIV